MSKVTKVGVDTVDLHQLLFIRPLEQQYHIQKQQQRNDDDSDLDDDMDRDDEEDNVKLDEYLNSNLSQVDTEFKILMNVYDEDKIVLLQAEDEMKLTQFPTLIDSEDEDEYTQPNAKNHNDFAMDDDDDDDFNMNKARKLNKKEAPSSHNISDKQRELIRIQRGQDEYYKYQYYALNSVQKDDNYMLWNAILGLTESFVYEKIDRDKYNGSVTLYCHEVKRRNEPYNNVPIMDNEARYNTDTSNELEP
eukprot:57671_1